MSNSFFRMSADEIRDIWQSRALAASRGKLRAVLTAVFAKEYAPEFPLLWRVTFGAQDVPKPFISGYAKIYPSGRLVADVTDEDDVQRPTRIYDSLDEYTFAARRLADRLKLRDSERIAFFSTLRKWVVADLRVGPEGQKLAS